MATGAFDGAIATTNASESAIDAAPLLAGPAYGQLRELREDVKKAIEKQRTGQMGGIPDFDVHEALKATFELLLGAPEKRGSVQLQAEAFQTLENLLDLETLELSQDEQKQLARVLYDYWQSDVPNIHCRTLLDSLLGREPDSRTPYLVSSLLRLLAPAYSPANKAAIQILVAIVDHCSDDELEHFLPKLWDKLVQSLHEQTAAVQASKILVKLSIRWYTNDVAKLASRLQPPLLDEEPGVRQTVFENLLPPLLTRFENLFLHLSSGLQSLPTGAPVLPYLKLVRSGLQAQPSSFALPETFLTLLERTIVHANPLVRLEAMKLLVALPGEKPATQRLPSSHFALYQTFWTYNIQESDSATFSTGLVGCWKAFIVRCRTSSSAARRDLDKLEKQVKKGLLSSVESEGIPLLAYIQAVEQFLTWWAQLAVEQLAPSKPYRCQINALKYVEMLLREGIDPDYQDAPANQRNSVAWAFQIQVVRDANFSAKLLHCLTSTYEDIKTNAFNLLLKCPMKTDQIASLRLKALAYLGGSRDSEIVTGTLFLRLLQEKGKASRAEAASADAIKTITLEDLLLLIKRQLAEARRDFVKAAAEEPLHGCLSAINLLLHDKQNVSRDVLLQSSEIVNATWTLARPYLLQDNLGAEEDVDSESLVLSAAWRAMKEVGDILSTILCYLAQDSQVPLSELSAHARLFETWLLEIEQRGAVAHISAAYGRVCSTSSKGRNKAACLPRQWVETNLDQILLQERPMTRRSGGLPYLILGALGGSALDPKILEYTFQRLLGAPRSDGDASGAARFHALNILRVLFLDSKLAQAAKPYLEEAFVTAVEGFGSSTWDVRNASLLLYAGLIQRVFGTKREHLPVHKRPSFFDFFSDNKRLHVKILAELQKHQNDTDSSSLGSVFSALLLLSLLQSTDSGLAAQALVEPFLNLVNAYSASRVWKVREAAAAAITGLTSPNQTYERCDAILSSLSNAECQNAIHGKLLQVLHLIKTASEPAQDASIPSIERLATLLTSNNSPAIRTVCLKILTATSYPVPTSIIDLVRDQLGKTSSSSAREATWQRTATRLLLTHGGPSTRTDLLQGSVAAQFEALAYLQMNPQALDHQILPLIVQIMHSEYGDLNNAASAAGVLLACSPELLKHIDSLRIWQIYTKARSPFVKDAILPLLARLQSINQEDLQQVWTESIVPSSQQESQSTRLSSCRALSYISPAAIGEFKHASLLVRFLQDEDMAIRHLAAETASKYYFHGQPVQSTLASDRVWSRVVETSTASDACEMYEEAFAGLDSLLVGMEPQAGVLFAVEKTNVYIDISVDQAWLSKLFAKHAAGIRAKRKDIEPRLHQASQTVEDHAVRRGSKDASNGPNTYIAADVLEEARLRMRTLSVVM